METGSSDLLSLPAELLHRIFEYLENHDVLAARRSCVVLGDVGKDHILQEVVGVYKREWLQQLADVANDPYFSKRIKAFYFQADAYGPALPFDSWKKECEQFRKVKNIVDAFRAWDDPDPTAPMEGRKLRAAARAVKKHESPSDDRLDGPDVHHAYSSYTATVADQSQMRAEGFDQHRLKALFQNCPNLDKVTMTCGPGQETHFPLAKRAFKDCLHSPDQDIQEEGVDQLYCLVKALNGVDKRLRSLSVDGLSYGVFGYDSIGEFAEMDRFLSHLHTFRVGITCSVDPAVHDEETIERAEDDAKDWIGNGALMRGFAAAPRLRNLKLSMPDFGEGPIHLFDVMYARSFWPELRSLDLSSFTMDGDDLTNFLLRHKAHLRRLCLSYIDIHNSKWKQVIGSIAGQLPELRKVKLRGDLSEDTRLRYDFDIPGLESRRINAERDCFENAILNGGDTSYIFDKSDPPQDYWYHGEYPWDVPDYTRPRRENLPEDDGYASEDSDASLAD